MSKIIKPHAHTPTVLLKEIVCVPKALKTVIKQFPSSFTLLIRLARCLYLGIYCVRISVCLFSCVKTGVTVTACSLLIIYDLNTRLKAILHPRSQCLGFEISQMTFCFIKFSLHNVHQV